MLPNESLVLDGLNLTTGVYRLAMPDGIVHTPARKRQEWVQGADSDGAVLLRDPLSENCTWSLKVRIVGAASRDAANQAIGAIEDKLEEAERQSDGLSLVWTPAGGTLSLTWYVLSGEVEELPITVESGYFAGAAGSPLVSVRLDCKPFGEGAPVTASSTSSSTPVIASYVISSIAGDDSAKARLVLTDLATQSRRWVEGGVQSRWYDAATNLLLDTSQLTITGFAGSSQTRAGSYSTNVFRGALGTQPTAICGTGNKTHVGTFRVIGRVYAAPASGNPADIHVRFSYQDGSGVFRAGGYTSSPVANAWGRVDLGTITITQAQQGTQQWSGRVETYSVAAGDTLDVDFLWLVPVDEGYFKIAATYNYVAGALVARDEFTSITAGTVLNARTAPLGGAWATSGATTDFVAADAPLATDETESRSTSADTGVGRLAILGATNYTDVEAGVLFRGTQQYSGVIARWVDANNYLQLRFGINELRLLQVVASVTTTIATVATSGFQVAGWYGLRLVVYATGRAIGYWVDSNGATLTSVQGISAAIATGGALATGKPGFSDYNASGTSVARYYDNFYVATPAPEPIALYSGKAAEVRFDGYQRQDASSVWGPMAARGGKSYLYLAPAGAASRSTRITCMGHRNDLSTAAWEPVTDNLQAQVIFTPRYLAVPR